MGVNISTRVQGLAVTLLRVVIGVVFLMHGGQKLFFGFANVAAMMSHLRIPFPMLSAVVVTLVEFFGGLCLALGVFARLAATLIAVDMLVAFLVAHLRGGFFLPQGFEYVLTLLAANVLLAATGPGAAALGALIRRRQI